MTYHISAVWPTSIKRIPYRCDKNQIVKWEQDHTESEKKHTAKERRKLPRSNETRIYHFQWWQNIRITNYNQPPLDLLKKWSIHHSLISSNTSFEFNQHSFLWFYFPWFFAHIRWIMGTNDLPRYFLNNILDRWKNIERWRNNVKKEKGGRRRKRILSFSYVVKPHRFSSLFVTTYLHHDICSHQLLPSIVPFECTSWSARWRSCCILFHFVLILRSFGFFLGSFSLSLSLSLSPLFWMPTLQIVIT